MFKRFKTYDLAYGFPCQDCLKCDGSYCQAWKRNREEVKMYLEAMESVLECRYFCTDSRGKRMDCSNCGRDGLKKGKVFTHNRNIGICSVCQGRGWIWEQVYEEITL